MTIHRHSAIVAAAIVSLSLATLAGAQEWMYTYGDGWISDLVTAADGHHLAVGTSTAPSGPGGNAEGDGLIISVDPNGSVRWALAIGGPRTEGFTGLALFPFGIMAVGVAETGTGPSRAVVVAVADDGVVLWQRDLGELVGAGIVRVASSTDGGCHVVAAMQAGGAQANAIVKMAPDGAVVWHREIDYSPGGWPLVAPGDAGGAIVATKYRQSAAFRELPHLLSFDAAGDVQWCRRYGATYDYGVYGLTRIAGGSFVVTGGMHPPLGPLTAADQWTMVTDPAGLATWQSRFGLVGIGDDARDAAPTPDGGFLVFGNTYSTPRNHLSRLDAGGALVATHEAADFRWWRHLHAGPDGILASMASTGASGGPAIGLARLSFDGLGTTPCLSSSDVTLVAAVPPLDEAPATIPSASLLLAPVDAAFAVVSLDLQAECPGVACLPLGCRGLRADPAPCQGGSVTLILETVGGLGPVAVSWDLDGDGAPDATGNPVTVVAGPVPWSVTATVLDACSPVPQACSVTRVFGACLPEDCLGGIDEDGDTLIDCLDAPDCCGSAACLVPLPDVTLVFVSKTAPPVDEAVVSWLPAAASRPGGSFDVATGCLSSPPPRAVPPDPGCLLQDRSFASGTCASDDFFAPPLLDRRSFPPGVMAWYYLVREQAPCGIVSSYGRGSFDVERMLGGSDCGR